MSKYCAQLILSFICPIFVVAAAMYWFADTLVSVLNVHQLRARRWVASSHSILNVWNYIMYFIITKLYCPGQNMAWNENINANCENTRSTAAKLKYNYFGRRTRKNLFAELYGDFNSFFCSDLIHTERCMHHTANVVSHITCPQSQFMQIIIFIYRSIHVLLTELIDFQLRKWVAVE